MTMADEQNAGGAPDAAAAAAAAAAATAQAAQSAVADNTSSEPWYATAGLDDDVKTFVSGKQFATIGDALKAGMHADKIARERNVLEVPDPNNIAAWKGWENLGWTPDEAKYAVDLPEGAKDLGDLAEGYKGFHQHLVKQLHGQRVPLNAAKTIAAEIVAFNVAGIREADAAIARERTELETGLKREWGGAFDANKEMAKRAMQTFKLGEADAGEIDALLGSTRMVKLFHDIGQMMGEDKLVTAKGGQGGGVEAAKAAKLALESDPAQMAALTDPANPHHARVKAERERLQQIIFASAT
jgi:hypothetical protein